MVIASVRPDWGHHRRDLLSMSESKKNGSVVAPASFDELSSCLTPHPSKAQILIETCPTGTTLEGALAVLRASGICEVEHQVLREGDPSWIRLRLSSDDFRKAILSLTEAGFVKLKGIHPEAKRSINRKDLK